jgi:arabinogalactan oligomer/maltooligosaccharide transport system permease protein
LNLRTRLFIAVLLAPAFVVLLALVIAPLFLNVVLSFSNASINHLHEWRLTGFQQYISVFGEQLFWILLLKTGIWTVVNVAFHLGIGVLLAVILHQNFIRGKTLWNVALLLPWAVPAYIGALTWRELFNYGDGAVNQFLTEYLRLSPVQWLTSPFEAFVAVIITNIWLGFPFMMAIALAGLQSIPQELYEAADLDGASPWFQFWHITAPLLRRLMIPAMTLSAVWTFNNINVVWLVSNMGEPADSTHTLVTYAYNAAFFMHSFGWAAALSIVTLAILFLFAKLIYRPIKTSEPVY